MSLPKHHTQTNRRSLLLGGGALALLAACGFTPVHSTRSTAHTLFGHMRYDVPESLAGYRLRQAMRDQFGEGSTYLLQVSLDIRENEAATTASGSTLRYTLLGRAQYTLKDEANGRTLSEGIVDTFSGYSASASTRATVSARRDAEERLAALLADRIAQKLILTATP